MKINYEVEMSCTILSGVTITAKARTCQVMVRFVCFEKGVVIHAYFSD